MKPKLSITALLSLVFGLVLLFAVGSVLWVGLTGANKNTAMLMGQISELSMTGVIEQIHGQLDPVEGALDDLSAQLSREQGGLEQIGALLNGTLAGLPQVAALAYISNDQTFYGISRDERKAVTESWQQLAWAQGLLSIAAPGHHAIWRAPTWSQRLQRAVLPVAYPVFSGGEYQGLLVAAIDIAGFSRYLSAVSQQIQRKVFILYGRDRVLSYPGLHERELQATAHRSPLPGLSDIHDPVLQRIWDPGQRRTWQVLEQTQSHRVRYRGTTTLYFYRTLSGYGPEPWLVGTYVEIEEQPEEITRLYWVLGASALLLLVFLVLTRWFSGLIGKRIGRIANGFAAIGTQQLETVATLPGSSVKEFDQVAGAYNQMLGTLREHERVRSLFGQYLPERVAKELVQGADQLEPRQAMATILFCDLEGFSSLAERIAPAALVEVLNEYFSAVADIIERHGGVITQFQGDAILASFNLPTPVEAHAAQALSAGREILRLVEARRFSAERLNCRLGIASGEVLAGSVGAKDRLSYTVHGDAVNLAARLEVLNKEYGTRLLTEGVTRAQAGDVGLVAVDRMKVRGRDRPVELFTLAESRVQ